MNKYILELLKNGLWVFPIKGKGRTIEEAKRPLTFREGDEIITWKNEKILNYAEELARKGHRAWALWLWKSNLFGIDIDLYKSEIPNKDKIFNELKEALKGNPGFYVEASARGGIHIITGVIDDTLLKLKASEKWIEHKHDGYFIIYPTCLETEEGRYCYEKIGGNLWYPGTLDVTLDLLSGILSKVLGKEVTLEVIESRQVGIRIEGSLKLEGLKFNIDDLNDKQINALLYLLFDEAGCEGMKKLIEFIDEHGVVPIKKEMYNILKIPRTTRWIVQYILASVLAWLGFSAERTSNWMTSWEFIDEKEEPRKDSLGNALYNVYSRGSLFLIPRAACPICPLLLDKDSCWDTPIHKVLSIPKHRIKEMVDFIREYVQ